MELYDLLLAKSLNGGGGGGGLFVATYTKNNDTWECDKTAAEIVGAIKRGAQVWAQNTDTGNMYFVAAWWENDENDLGVKFVYIDIASTEDGFSMGFDSFYHSYDSGEELINADSGWGEVHQ